MKTTISLLLLFLIACTSMKAQISPSVIKKFPAHIVFKISDLNKIVPISEQKQMIIGSNMLQRDSLATANLAKGETIEKVKNYATLDPQFLKNTLSQEELERYYSYLNPENRFLLALTLSKELDLNTNQINEIRKQNEVLNSLKIYENYRKIQYYSGQLSTILTQKQYEELIPNLYKTESLEQSLKEWRSILNYNLVPIKDSSAVIATLYKYNLIRFSGLDPKLYETENARTREIKDRIFVESEPAILTHCHIVSEQWYKKNLFAEVLQFGKQINLTKIQTDSLLANYKRLEMKKFKSISDPHFIVSYAQITRIESEAVFRLLDQKQLMDFLYNKNVIKAKKTAYNDWLLLEQENIVNGLDKEKTLNELSEYYSNLFAANDRANIDGSQMSIFARRDMELRKPELLKKLNSIQKTKNEQKKAKTELKW